MVDFIMWKEEYSVEIPEIDAQHIRIVGVINKLFFNKQQNGSHGVEFKKQLLLIKIYTETHFQYEETLMRYAQYPRYEEHRQEHSYMIKKTDEIIKAFYSDSRDQHESLFQFLKKWWIEHIQGTDRRYTSHMLKLGL